MGDFFVIFLVIEQGVARFFSSSSDKSDGVFHSSLLSERLYVDLRPVNPRGDYRNFEGEEVHLKNPSSPLPESGVAEIRVLTDSVETLQ